MAISLVLASCLFAQGPQSNPAGAPVGIPPERPIEGTSPGGPGTIGPPPPPLPPFGPPDGNDVEVSSPSDDDQEEVVIRVNPVDRLNLIAGANDNRFGPYNSAFYSSHDGGLTWSELHYPIQPPQTNAADPAAAFGPNGEAYFLTLSYFPDSGLYVGQSLDGGLTVPNWVEAVAPNSANFEDKPFMTADAGTGALSGAVYATWTRFKNSGGTPIMMVGSFDGGATWSAPKQVSDRADCQGSCPTVGPNGELYVAWLDWAREEVMIDVSLDGGLTWGTDVKIADVDSLNFVPHTSFRVNSFPSIDVDTSGGPYHGTIYACWAENEPADPDVLFSKSTDGGATWSTPVPAHDVLTNTQFCPWVDVDVNGNVNFSFYDRRDNPSDIRLHYYVSRSSDGGATLQPNVSASDRAFNPNTYPQGGFIGDYTGVAASDRTVHPIWADGRDGTNDVYTSRVQLDLHTDIKRISAATGGVANFTLNPGPLYQFVNYMLLGSISGTAPGFTLDGVEVPLNFDAFTTFTIVFANTPALQGFRGALDATGTATARIDTGGPVDPSLIGLQMDFSGLVFTGSNFLWASNPTHLEIVP